MLKSAASFAVLAAALALAVPQPAVAVNLTSGTIETSGQNATVDAWFFTLNGAASLNTGVNLTALGGPITTEDLGLLVYTNVGGTIGALIGQAGIAGDGISQARLDFLPLAPGDYIAVVSSSTLSPGEFGPFQTDPDVSIAIDYELVLDLVGGNETTYTCSIQGNLDGTSTKSPGDAVCFLPAADRVPEPGSLALLLAGIAGAAGLGARRRG
jgi:hypothetical protein